MRRSTNPFMAICLALLITAINGGGLVMASSFADKGPMVAKWQIALTQTLNTLADQTLADQQSAQAAPTQALVSSAEVADTPAMAGSRPAPCKSSECAGPLPQSAIINGPPATATQGDTLQSLSFANLQSQFRPPRV